MVEDGITVPEKHCPERKRRNNLEGDSGRFRPPLSARSLVCLGLVSRKRRPTTRMAFRDLSTSFAQPRAIEVP